MSELEALYEFEIVVVVVVVGQASLRHRNRKSDIPLRSERDLCCSIVIRDLELHSKLVIDLFYHSLIFIDYLLLTSFDSVDMVN